MQLKVDKCLKKAYIVCARSMDIKKKQIKESLFRKAIDLVKYYYVGLVPSSKSIDLAISGIYEDQSHRRSFQYDRQA